MLNSNELESIMNQLSKQSAEKYYSILLDIHKWVIDYSSKVPIFKNLLEIGILNEITGKNHFEDIYENNKIKEPGQRFELQNNLERMDRYGNKEKGEVRKALFTGIKDLFAKRNVAEHQKNINHAAYIGTLNTMSESIRDFSKIPIPDEMNRILNNEPLIGPIRGINKGISQGKKSKDLTKYIFNGEIFSKRRLVLAVINSYVKNNPSVTLEKLQNIFDREIQGTFYVVDSFINARKTTDGKRHFFEDAINLNNGQKIVVCSQWTKEMIDKFIVKANELRYDIKEE
jgi:hypothetical protein